MITKTLEKAYQSAFLLIVDNNLLINRNPYWPAVRGAGCRLPCYLGMDHRHLHLHVLVHEIHSGRAHLVRC